jgi:hypothetical protein
MAKRKATRKKKLESSRKKTKKGVTKQKRAKKTRGVAPASGRAAKKKAVKKKPSKKKVTKVLTSGKKAKKKARARSKEPGLPLKEVRARLGLIAPQLTELSWLDGIYIYGSELLKEPRLKRINFIIVYRGLRSASRLEAAEAELRMLITAVLPVEFNLSTGTPVIGRLFAEGNPAVQAHLGYAEPIFDRDN